LNKVYLVKGNERARKADESNPNSISNKVFGCPVVEIVHCGMRPSLCLSLVSPIALTRRRLRIALPNVAGKCKKEIKPQGSDSFIYYSYVTEVRSVTITTTITLSSTCFRLSGPAWVPRDSADLVASTLPRCGCAERSTRSIPIFSLTDC
jgi:hypothetical protein